MVGKTKKVKAAAKKTSPARKATTKKTAATRPSARAAASAMPVEGAKAPVFSATAGDGSTVTLASFRGQQIVALYFYPKDNTSGCTKEACGFRDDWTALARAGVAVIGVSPDSPASHAKFAAKFGLPFTLVADEDHSICKAYGVWQEKSMYGRKYFGVVRTTFVIDREGRIAKVFEKVKPDGHSADVLAWVREHL